MALRWALQDSLVKWHFRRHRQPYTTGHLAISWLVALAKAVPMPVVRWVQIVRCRQQHLDSGGGWNRRLQIEPMPDGFRRAAVKGGLLRRIGIGRLGGCQGMAAECLAIAGIDRQRQHIQGSGLGGIAALGCLPGVVGGQAGAVHKGSWHEGGFGARCSGLMGQLERIEVTDGLERLASGGDGFFAERQVVDGGLVADLNQPDGQTLFAYPGEAPGEEAAAEHDARAQLFGGLQQPDPSCAVVPEEQGQATAGAGRHRHGLFRHRDQHLLEPAQPWWMGVGFAATDSVRVAFRAV